MYKIGFTVCAEKVNLQQTLDFDKCELTIFLKSR